MPLKSEQVWKRIRPGAADIAGNRHRGRIGWLDRAAHLAMLAGMAMLPPDGKGGA